MFAWWDSLRLKSTNPLVRSKAVENLSGSTRSGDTERLLASLQDESPHVRCAAVKALEKARSQNTLRSLLIALNDDAPEVREAAARVLGRSGVPKVTGELVMCLKKDTDLSVRRAAAGALRALGWRPSTREEAALYDLALGNTRAAISASGIPMESATVEPAQDTAFHRRMRAETLRERDDPARIASLLTAARSEDLLARISAIHDLGEVNNPAVSEELPRHLRDPEKEVRFAAAQALAGRADTQPAHLLGLLEDSSDEIRLVAVRFFSRVPSQQIAQVLLPLLCDPVAEVREATATTIGLIGDAASIEDLVVALTDDDARVSRAAHQSLNQLDPNWLVSEGASAARPRLEALLAIRPPSDHEGIQQLLQSIGSRESIVADGVGSSYTQTFD
jgi:HEAT repeat protein